MDKLTQTLETIDKMTPERILEAISFFFGGDQSKDLDTIMDLLHHVNFRADRGEPFTYADTGTTYDMEQPQAESTMVSHVPEFTPDETREIPGVPQDEEEYAGQFPNLNSVLRTMERAKQKEEKDLRPLPGLDMSKYREYISDEDTSDEPTQFAPPPHLKEIQSDIRNDLLEIGSSLDEKGFKRQADAADLALKILTTAWKN